MTRTFGKSERMFDALKREGAPHFGSACFKIDFFFSCLALKTHFCQQ